MKKIIFFISVFLFNSSWLFASESQTSEGLPQLNYKTFPEQVFWFLIIFGLLYLFISKYVVPKIKSIQNSRERLIQQNNNTCKKYIIEAEKVKNIISFQIKSAEETSKQALKKLNYELIKIEEKRINEVKLNNNKIKSSLSDNLNSIDENFIKEFQNNLNDITSILLKKVNISLPQEKITEEIQKHNFSIKDYINV